MPGVAVASAGLKFFGEYVSDLRSVKSFPVLLVECTFLRDLPELL